MDLFSSWPRRKAGFILDMHVHVAGIGAGSGCRISPRLRRNWRFGLYLQAFGTSLQELAAQGDAVVVKRIAHGVVAARQVDGALLLALDQVYDPARRLPVPERTELYIPNDFIRDSIAPYPQLFYGASVNPYRADWQEELRRVHADGALLVKWLPAIQRINPVDPAIVPFYRLLRELNLPLLVHTGAERSFAGGHNELGDPRLLHLPVQEGVTVIAAHLATSGKQDRVEYMDHLLPMLAQFDNLFADISSLTQVNKRRYALQILGRQDLFAKLLYGSDFPLTNVGIGPCRLVSPWYFFPRLPVKTIHALNRVDNVWDRDYLLKRALGFPEEVFTRSARILLREKDRNS